LFSSPLRPPPLPSLFPYTTLFRSRSLDHVLTMSATLAATNPSAGTPPTDQYPQPAVIPTFEEARQRAAELPAHLRGAVDQAGTLLGAAGAMLYLLDDQGTTLRWAYDAGIRDVDE